MNKMLDKMLGKMLGSFGMLAFVLLAGVNSCSSSGSGGTDAAAGGDTAGNLDTGGGASVADSFVGTWTFDSGNLTPMSCMIGGMAVPSLPLTGRTLVITKVDATHVTSAFGQMCSITFAVGSTLGTATAAQTCTVALSSGNVSITVDTWTLTPTSAGLTTDMTGTVPALTGCSVSGGGTLTKTSP
jgi:hypothetical protein